MVKVSNFIKSIDLLFNLDKVIWITHFDIAVICAEKNGKKTAKFSS